MRNGMVDASLVDLNVRPEEGQSRPASVERQAGSDELSAFQGEERIEKWRVWLSTVRFSQWLLYRRKARKATD